MRPLTFGIGIVWTRCKYSFSRALNPTRDARKSVAVLAQFGKAFSQQPPHLPRDSAGPEENLYTGLVDIPYLPTRFLACRDKCAINSVSGLVSFLRRSNG